VTRRDTTRDELVVKALATGPLLRRDLEDELGLSSRDVTTSLWHLKRAGRVTREGPHNVPRWRLVQNPGE
jgi:DNA-binding HxlR family transcriptional regulator